MKNKTFDPQKTRRLVAAAMLTAIVVVLQLLGSFIRFGPFSVSLVLVPIVIGAAVLGWKTGLWLGFAFGAAVLISGDAAAFLAVSVPGTLITVMLKGIGAGAAAAFGYKLLSKHEIPAVAFTAFVCPVVNTGIFLLGCRVFFWPTLEEWGASLGFSNAAAYAIGGMVGFNFLFELGVNIIFCPVIVRLLRIPAIARFLYGRSEQREKPVD